MEDLRGICHPVGETYPDCLRRLYSINGALKSDGITMPSQDSLAGTRALYELLGRPLDRIPTIHVGGTNGKGTTSFKIAQCLRGSGLKTGLFVSPHISSSRERIQVNNDLISEQEVVHLLPRILDICVLHGIPATLFEVTFLLSCLQFDTCKCDVVVMEVGMGGKFDATNVISTICSVLCSVSLDHTRILGSTVEAIARVKAGAIEHFNQTSQLNFAHANAPFRYIQTSSTSSCGDGNTDRGIEGRGGKDRNHTLSGGRSVAGGC